MYFLQRHHQLLREGGVDSTNFIKDESGLLVIQGKDGCRKISQEWSTGLPMLLTLVIAIDFVPFLIPDLLPMS